MSRCRSFDPVFLIVVGRRPVGISQAAGFLPGRWRGWQPGQVATWHETRRRTRATTRPSVTSGSARRRWCAGGSVRQRLCSPLPP